jgi:hypothetical protein
MFADNESKLLAATMALSAVRIVVPEVLLLAWSLALQRTMQTVYQRRHRAARTAHYILLSVKSTEVVLS